MTLIPNERLVKYPVKYKSKKVRERIKIEIYFHYYNQGNKNEYMF